MCERNVNAQGERGFMKLVKLKLPPEVADWLAAQPGGGAEFVTEMVRQRMPRSVELPSLSHLPSDVAERALKLARYPQLVEAVARELVTIDRAEAMALEADDRVK